MKKTFEEIVPAGAFQGVASDCKPFPYLSSIGVEMEADCVQKKLDALWRESSREIYSRYDLYHQSVGKEHSVFRSDREKQVTRSEQLIEVLRQKVQITEEGRLLDFGYGNGSFLKAFSVRFPNWKLQGVETSLRDAEKVKAEVSVEALHDFSEWDPSLSEEVFDVVALIHVLEHIEDVKSVLRSCQRVLKPGGYLVVQVPNYIENPFDLLVSDHARHFDPESLERIVCKEGFQVEVLGDWISREITLIASIGEGSRAFQRGFLKESRYSLVKARFDWLIAVRALAWDLRKKNRKFGVFGTTIAAAWLLGELNHTIDFFVDEDINKQGGSSLGVPIIKPLEVTCESSVFLCLPPSLADRIFRRAQKYSWPGLYIVPPVLQEIGK